MKILLQDNKDLAKAHDIYTQFTQNDQMRELYEAREKWRKDYNSAIDTATTEARQKGKLEGKLEDCIKMHQEGIPLDTISRITGLSIEAIQNKIKLEE